MKNLYRQFKPFMLFLGKFLLSYLVLTFIYQWYLNQFIAAIFEVDGFTKIVANQTEGIMKLFGCDAFVEKNSQEASVNLFYNQKWVARIVEGCNALSIIILFISFVISFSGKIKTTTLFILAGSLLIHAINVVRIALLAVLIYNYPMYESFLHGVLFPLIIYGFVFFLWVFWVNNFSKYASKSSK